MIFSVDDILKIKNAPQAKNSKGKAGGYQEFYRKNTDNIIIKLENLKNEFEDNYFDISKFHYSSKGKSKFYYFFTPTDIFLEAIKNKQNETIYNSKIFKYHHNKEAFEKFLGIYFSQNKLPKIIFVKDIFQILISMILKIFVVFYLQKFKENKKIYQKFEKI